MKYVSTLLLAGACCQAMAQVPTLPYNSDWNNNGIIETVDLMQLLSDFGELFSSAVVSEDEESAIVYMGDMPYPQCDYSCSQLPGQWRMPQLKELVPVWSEVYNSSGPYTWLRGQEEAGSFPMFRGNSYATNSTYVENQAASFACTQNMRCYCASKQMPRVEYFRCMGYGSDAVDECISCVNTKVSEGWYLLAPSTATSQELWRWAE